MSRFLEKQEWTPSLNKNQLREKLRRNLIDSSMLKYGLDNFVDGAIFSKKRYFDPQVRRIVQEFLGTTDNEDDNPMSNGLTGREYSYDNKYNSYHHSYGRNERNERSDRDYYYYSSHSRRSDHDSNSQMEYDVDNTEQDMEVDDDTSSSSSSQSEQVKTENEIDSSVQARLDSFLQTFKEVSKQQQQRKQIQSQQESVTNSAESSSSSDSTDMISKLSSGVSTKPLSSKPTFKFNLNIVKNEPGTSGSDSNSQSNVSKLISNCDESKDDFSTQDMKLEEVSPNSDLTPNLRDSYEGPEIKTESIKESSMDATANMTPEPSPTLQGKSVSLIAPVTLPPAHLLADSQLPIEDEYDDDGDDDDDMSNSPKAPTPEPISPGPIDVNLEEETPNQPLVTPVINENASNENPFTNTDTCQVTRTELSNSSDSRGGVKEQISIKPSNLTTPEALKTASIPTENITNACDNVDKSTSKDDDKMNAIKIKSEIESTSTQIATNEVKKEPKNIQENPPSKCSVPQSSQKASNKSKTSIKIEPVSNVPDVPLEEILSDVSSVHTSDLSDFDDLISISSSEELSFYATSKEQEPSLSLSVTLNSTAAPTASSSGRRKISLQEVKQQLQAGERVASASSSVASSGGSISQSAKSKRKRSNANIASHQSEVNKQQNISAKGRRERKVNPKYASDEYSSIYNRKKGSGVSQGLMEEEIDSDEDFDLQSLEETSSKGHINSPPVSVDAGEMVKDLENDAESAGPPAEEDEENSSSITSPIDCPSDTSVSTASANARKFRKKVQQRQVRYDASDLYKPRPSIGSSRRRNVNNET